MKSLTSTLILGTAIVATPLSVTVAQSADYCKQTGCENKLNQSVNPAKQGAENIGFSISVDDEVVDGSSAIAAERKNVDLTLNNMDIQVKFDGLGVKPILNISTMNTRRSFQAGEVIGFNATLNYQSWIAASEVRIYERGQETADRPIAIVPVNRAGQAEWVMPHSGGRDYVYKLRVYDEEGRFDETILLSLARMSSQYSAHQTDADVISVGNGEDRTAFRNIPVYGGAVTVYGSDVPNGHSVRVFGEQFKTDEKGSFVVQRILPPGDHNVQVSVGNRNGDGVSFDHSIHIPQNEWFYVGLADLTIGRKLGGDDLQSASGEFDEVYKKGRLAFYLKGKIKGRYLLTAAADTREGDLEYLFKNINSKDPRQLLRRIDPDEYYPVYGDDSEFVEDAPTNGKFYVRLERGDSHVMWGNFKTKVSGSKFIRSERNLYGAQSVYRSQSVTPHGDRRMEVEMYAAQPNTLPQRDSLRGTGGSAYFLTRQDIQKGTERVSIEVRDLITGRVVDRKYLQYGDDYTIDYIQGVIILKKPLASTSSDGDLIRSGSLGDRGAYLSVQYEYTPALQDVSGYSYGGRGQVWVGNHVRIGVSGMSENADTIDNRTIGADIHLRLGQNSHINAEIAKSEGPGYSRSSSLNGGLTINNSTVYGANGRSAQAYSIEGKIDLSDIDPTKHGHIGAHFERREAGFASLDYNTGVAQTVVGVDGEIEVNKELKLKAKYEDFSDANGKIYREANVETERKIGTNWALKTGVQHTTRAAPLTAYNNGHRTDIGVKLTRRYNDDSSAYVFGQLTAHRDGKMQRNDRIGLGGETRLTEKIGVKGEVSHGTSGVGGLAALTYDPTVDDHYYAGYSVDADRGETSGSILNGTDLGGLVLGRKRRYSDELSAYAENNYDLFGARRSLTSTYGVVYTPNALWILNGGFEYGDIQETNGEKLNRKAISLSVGYKQQNLFSWRVKGEVRLEDSHIASYNRDTYLLSAALMNKVNENWRIHGSLDVLLSNSSQSDILNGDYVEGSFGYAYRPVENDHFNALLKYGFLYDLPGPDQIAVNGSTLGPAQRSHVFTADGVIDLNQYFSFGAKYGYRIGQVSTSRSASDFVDSSAYLGVVRLDVHVVKNWDALFEARILGSRTAKTTNLGFLVGANRHINDNIKLGVGYNFGRFSDDLTDLTHDDRGMYLNVVGKI